jgi:glycosyltransferase involved in cell wall biosynthesis
MKAFIFDPSTLDKGSIHRGGGRFISLLKENLEDSVTFVSSFNEIKSQDTLVIPFFNPFTSPFLKKRVCKTQILVIFDAIPLRYTHAFPVGIKGKLNVLRNIMSLQIYDRIITISQEAKKDIVKYLHVKEEKVEVIYLTLPTLFTCNTNLQLSKNYNLPEKYLIYVADVNWNKNIVTIAKAIKKAQMPCVFVGKVFGDLTQKFDHPWQKDLKDFVYETKTNPLFIFPGYVGDEDLVYLYKNAFANILVSRDEGFGLSFLEAASQKTPSVLSDKPIFHEIAKDSALFAKCDSVEDIVGKIHELENSSLRAQLSQKAFERSLFFNSNTFKQCWLSLLNLPNAASLLIK